MRCATTDPSLPDECRRGGSSQPLVFIKPTASGYMVAALAEELRSPFRGRKPERREDHRKRTRRSETIGAALASTLHSPSMGRKPWRREASCEGTRPPRSGAKNS